MILFKTQRQKDGAAIFVIATAAVIVGSSIVVHGPGWYAKAMSMVNKPAIVAPPANPTA